MEVQEIGKRACGLNPLTPFKISECPGGDVMQQKEKHVEFRGDTEKPKLGCHFHALGIADHEMNNVMKTEVRFRCGILRY